MDIERIEAYRKSLAGKRILVVGMGKSGFAAVSVLHDLGACVTVQDSKEYDTLDKGIKEYLEKAGIQGFFGKTPDKPSDFYIYVMSPGVPCDLDWIQEAKKAGVEIIGELELGYRITEGRYVAITGTNGKTTTTTLVGEIFKASGRKTSVVGNIGNAVVTSAIESSDEDWMVAEVSSFQLETVKEFRPLVSAILNLTPDHLNRHKTMEAYGSAKAAIHANQTADDYLVINYDDKACYKLADGCKARLVPFSRKTKLDFGAYLDGEKLMLRDDNSEYLICERKDLQIIGDHNVENVLAASAIAYFAGIGMDIISQAVKDFPGVEHRIEYCGTVDGVKYYNDSKGTNVDAAIIALKALENDILLIAGGDGKAQDFTELAKALKGRVKHLILLGRDAKDIEKCAVKEGFDSIYFCNTMETCVEKCAELAKSGDKVLLSPACASWDMYPNYEKRGEHFKNCVSALNK